MLMGKGNSSLSVQVVLIVHQWEVLPIIQVVMGRRLLGVFMTVYMPTILINIIGHSTNYFSDTYFEATITVNLTASTTSLNKSF